MKTSRIPTTILILFLAIFGLTAVSTQAQSRELILLEFDGPVTPIMFTYFERGLGEADQSNAEAVLIVLNTPGGAVDVTIDIIELFRNSDIPVIVYVAPSGAQAASAGSLITAAGHLSAMAPETVIGAASPINMDGSDINETAYRKAVEDLKATMRTLTTERGETAVTLAEEMIEESRAVTAQEALDAGFIDLIANNQEGLLEAVDGRTVIVQGEPVTLSTAGVPIRPIELSWIEQFLSILVNPLLVTALFSLGITAIIVEIRSPGFGVAGGIGGFMILLGLFGLNQLPANLFGLILIAAAFALFVTEAFTSTSGPLSIAGGLTLLIGILVLFNSPGTPDFARVSVSGAIGITMVTTAFFAFITYKIIESSRVQPTTGYEAMLGHQAQARADFADKNGRFQGTVLMSGEIWRAVADEPVTSGENVIVKSVDGFTLKVKKDNL